MRFRNYVLQNFPFLEDDFDALTDYQLFCKMVAYMRKAVGKIDEFGKKLDEFENYFNNLDVQDEINNKLEDMYENGELENIISQFLQLQITYTYNSISEMKSASNLINGCFTRTSGYYSYDDYGGAYYKVRTKTNDDTIDDMTIIGLSDATLVAELLRPSTIRPEIFGAYGDGVHNDSDAISAMLDYVLNLESDNSDWEKTLPMVCENTYKIDEIEIPSDMQQVTIIGNNKGTFTDGGFTFPNGTGWHTTFRDLNFKECNNPINFEYYNIEYGKIYIENCTFNLCTGVALTIRRRSNQVFIKNNRFSYCDKTAYIEDVDMCYFEGNWIEINSVWSDNHHDVEQVANTEGTIFVKDNIFIPAENQSGSNVSWLKIERNANIENNRFSGENSGIHPIYIDYSEFDTFNPSSIYMYPIINIINNPIIASEGSILINKFCGQLNIHNNSFVRTSPCIEVVDPTIFTNLDYNKLYISISDNAGKIFNYRDSGYLPLDGTPIIPACLQKFIKRNNIYARNSNLNLEFSQNNKVLNIKYNTKDLDKSRFLQFIIYGCNRYNPSGSTSYFDNFIALVTLRRDYDIDDAKIYLKPTVKLISEHDPNFLTFTPTINNQSEIETTATVLDNDIEIEITYSNTVDTNAVIEYKGVVPLEFTPVNRDDKDYNTNN